MFFWQEWWDQRITERGYFFCLSYLPKILLAVVITLLDEAYYKVACWLNDKGEFMLSNVRCIWTEESGGKRCIHMEKSRCSCNRGQLKCDGTWAETRFCLSAKRMSPFKSAGVSVQLTTGSQGLRISGSNAGYTMFWGGVKGTGYPLHLPVSPLLPLPCITVCHHISTGVYYRSTLSAVIFRNASRLPQWLKVTKFPQATNCFSRE